MRKWPVEPQRGRGGDGRWGGRRGGRRERGRERRRERRRKQRKEKGKWTKKGGLCKKGFVLI